MSGQNKEMSGQNKEVPTAQEVANTANAAAHHCEKGQEDNGRKCSISPNLTQGAAATVGCDCKRPLESREA